MSLFDAAALRCSLCVDRLGLGADDFMLPRGDSFSEAGGCTLPRAAGGCTLPRAAYALLHASRCLALPRCYLHHVWGQAIGTLPQDRYPPPTSSSSYCPFTHLVLLLILHRTVRDIIVNVFDCDTCDLPTGVLLPPFMRLRPISWHLLTRMQLQSKSAIRQAMQLEWDLKRRFGAKTTGRVDVFTCGASQGRL